MRTVRWLGAGLLAALCWGGASAHAAPARVAPFEVAPPDTTLPDPTTEPTTVPATPTSVPFALPPALGPLVVVPTGCVAPEPARAVFIGQLNTTDETAGASPTTARFTLLSLLAGSLDGYAAENLVDVRYGDETKFLTVGQQYIVGVRVDDTTGLLTSTVREAAPLFGGDAVIGINDSDIDCPRVDDPVRTLDIRGTAVDTGVLTPLKGEGSSLLMAIVKPFAIAFGALVALVLLKHLFFAVGRSLREIPVRPSRPRVRRTRHHLTESAAAEQPVP